MVKEDLLTFEGKPLLTQPLVVLKDGRIQKRFDAEPGQKPSLFDLLHYMI